MSMRARTIVLIILIVLTTTAANVLSGLYFTSRSIDQTVEQDLEFAIGIADRLVATKMNLMKSEAITVALRLGAAASAGELHGLLMQQYNQYPDITALAVFDRNGVIDSYTQPQHEHDLNLNAEYMKLVYAGGTIIASPFYCSATNEFAMNVYTPLARGRILAVTMPGETFSEILSDQRLWRTGSIFMLNEVGMFIGAASQESVQAMNDYVLEEDGVPGGTDTEISELVRKILASDKGVERYVFEGREHLCAYSRIEGAVLGWRVAVSVPLDASPRAGALQGQLYTALCCLLVGVAAAFFLSKVTSRPFKKIELQNSELETMNKTVLEQASAIMEEHERVLLMLDATPLACRLWDKNFNLIECNEAAVKLFGLRNKKEYMDRYFELSPPYLPDGKTAREKIEEVVTEAFESGGSVYEWEYRAVDGSPIPSEVTMVRIPYGGDYAVAAYSRDLREQKKMMAEIGHRDNLLDVSRRVSFILFDAAEDRKIEAVLKESMALLGECVDADQVYITQNETVDGASCFTCRSAWAGGAGSAKPAISPGMRFPWGLDQEWDARLRQGECMNGPVANFPRPIQGFFASFETKSALVIPVFVQKNFWGLVGFSDCVAERTFGEDEVDILRSMSIIMAAAVNRSEQDANIRETSAQLQTALGRAKEANSAKSDFLAHMSHEIRTPLNAVVGLSELMLGEERLSLEAASNLEKIYGAGATILSIVNDILDISKIESGKFELNPIRYDTPSLINDTETLNMVRIGEKPIEFKVYVDENLPGSLYGDDLRVKQVFNNLLSNAFKYTHSGTVEWRVEFEREGSDIWLVSSVRDTGIGIKAKDMERLFASYNQVDTKANRKVEGTGLGLTIAKNLVEMMDGTIWAESVYGEGSTFHVRLRQDAASGRPIGRDVARSLMELHYTFSRRDKNVKLTRINLSYAHVLVVDDLETNLDVVRGMLKPYGVKVDCAISGQQAVDMIRTGDPRYAAIFMDHMMPGMDGIEAAEIIRRDVGTDYARHIPIIALTANAIAGNEEMFLAHDFQDFISKPIDIAKLDAVLRRWVRNKELEGEAPANREETEAAGRPGSGGSAFDSAAIEGVDARRALERFSGDEEVLLNVLSSYATNTRTLLSSLRKHLEAKDLANYAIVVHGIKGSSYGIYAQEAGKAAEDLETAAKAGDLGAVRAEHPAFERLVESLLGSLDQALEKLAAASEKPVAPAPDPALLDELRDACEAFDMDRVDAAMERLGSFRYERGEPTVAWLREQVNRMDFETIAGGKWPEA